MRRSTVIAVVVGLAVTATVTTWRHTSPPSRLAPVPNIPSVIECRWEPEQGFAFDVSIDSDLTFNEAALAPLLPGQANLNVTSQSQKGTATGWLDAKVLSVTSSGEAILAARLASWKTDAPGAGAFAELDRDMMRPYLLRIDSRCHILASARPKDANVIAYRRVLGVTDRMDFSLPPVGIDPTRSYTSRQVDDFGTYNSSNQYRRDSGRGAIERKRLAYEAGAAEKNALPMRIRIHSAGGSVSLGNSAWFTQISDSEDIDTVSNGKVPFRSRSSSKLVAQTPAPAAFDGVPIVLSDYVWGRPSEAEMELAHEALRGSDMKELAAADAVAKFLAQRDSGVPGSWHDAQRMLRDWMRANPDGVRELAREMVQHKYSRSDQADIVLAMAKSGSTAARHELEQLVKDTGAGTDLRVQAASACGDLKQPTVETVSVLKDIGSVDRSGTPEDILPSAATMALGSIIDTAPSADAAIEARKVLHDMLQQGQTGKTVEAFYAASNSGDASFLPQANTYAKSEQPEERAAAAHFVRKVQPSPETQQMLNSLMREDMQPEVVKQVAESRREQLQTYGGELGNGELALYATKLASAPEGVRWEILRTLGAASRLQPEAKGLLVDWYGSETVGALKVLIGQYVSASELRRH